MNLFSVVISYHRPELTLEAIRSYKETVTVPHMLVVVDNGSGSATQEMIRDAHRLGLIDGFSLRFENGYPGPAFNEACAGMWLPEEATIFHRCDNDFVFLPGWCDHLADAFRGKTIGQVGLRTNEEEEYAKTNVGGNMAVRRKLWDAGLRYDERPWTEMPQGYSEDSFLSPAVVEMGWRWTRVKHPCIRPISSEDPADPYYQQSWRDRGIHGMERA